MLEEFDDTMLAAGVVPHWICRAGRCWSCHNRFNTCEANPRRELNHADLSPVYWRALFVDFHILPKRIGPDCTGG